MRHSIALLTILFTALSLSEAQAWCWNRQPAVPYVVGYAPYSYVAPTGYAAGYAPVATPYTASYAPVNSVPQPTAMVPPATTVAPPVLSSGAYQAQRPTYYDNPSVYTGLPVTGGYTAARIPMVSNYRGTVSGGGNLSATNQYPNTFSSGTYASGYAAAQVPTTSAPVTAPGLPLSVATPTGVPATAIPATQVSPLFPPTPPRQSALSSFYGSWFGTNYRSSYYRTPITYYRPVTTVDPVSGTTVTVQQPCTLTVQQLQRTPYSGLQGPSTGYAQPAPGVSTPGCGNGCGVAPAPNVYQPPVGGSIGQVSANAVPGQYAVPIPSTAPPTIAPPTNTPNAGYGQGNYFPNTSPLTGAPQGAGSVQGSGDSAPLDQPALMNRPPINGNFQDDVESNDSVTPKPEPYWQLQDAEDSTAMIRPSEVVQNPAQPIYAPEDYVSPFRQRPQTQATPVNRSAYEDPQLPRSTVDSSDPETTSNWVSAPVREVSTATRRSYRPAVRQIQRDTTWKPARN